MQLVVQSLEFGKEKLNNELLALFLCKIALYQFFYLSLTNYGLYFG